MSIEVDGKSLGQLAFEVYRAEVVTAVNGDRIPDWDRLDNGAPARRGWEAAAAEVARLVRASDIADQHFDAAYSPPDYRSRQGSRWVPLSAPDAHYATDLYGAGPDQAYRPPVAEDRATQARESVPVEADDED